MNLCEFCYKEAWMKVDGKWLCSGHVSKDTLRADNEAKDAEIADRDDKWGRILNQLIATKAALERELAEAQALVVSLTEGEGSFSEHMADARRDTATEYVISLAAPHIDLVAFGEAVNGECSCGGGGPGECCPACSLWHRVFAAIDEPGGEG